MALPGFRLRYVEGGAPVGASKLGGLPDLPSGVPWPLRTWSGGDRRPMSFVGQIALEDADPAIWPGPRDGLLSFFCAIAIEYMGVDSGGSARVLHIPAGTSRDRRARPAGLPDELVLGEVPVTLAPELTIPGIDDDVANVLEPFGFG